VSGEPLRGARDRQVRAQLQRALQQRCRQRVVDGQQRALRVSGGGQRRHVEHGETGVGRRLDPDERGTRQCGGDRVGVGRDHAHLDAARA
jgi:hypothetical protein